MHAWTEIDSMEDHAGLSARLNLYRFLDLVESWTPIVGRPSLDSFLRHLRLLSDESAPKELDAVAVSRGPAVAILTVHRAKGLEWDTVVDSLGRRRWFPFEIHGLRQPRRQA